MDPLLPVQTVLTRTASRLRWLRGWRGLWSGALIGAAAYSVALGVYKVAPIPREWVTAVGWLSVLAVPLGFLWGARRATTQAEAARWLDERQGLQQRLSTALELGPQTANGPWRDLVVADASAAAQKVETSKLLPVFLPSLARGVLALLAVTVALGFLPEYRTKAHVQAKQEAAIIKEVGHELAQLTKRAIQQHPVLAEPTRKSLDDVKELGERLGQMKLTRDDALKELARATEQLKQQANDLARNPALRKMEKAARTPSGNGPQDQAAVQKKIEALQKQLGEKAPDADNAKELQKELEKMKQMAQAMADNASSDSKAAQQKQLSEMASQLSRKAESLGLPMPSLDDAVAALKGAQVDQFLKDLDLAEKDLEKMADLARQLAQLQQQAERLGKDLAEQLKNGQAQAAAESLKKMQELLKQPGLSQAQQEKLASEIKDALKPAEPYGAVAEHLAKALKQTQSGDRAGARESLAAAQKELEDLLNDMGDMQAMMAAMQGLKTGQMAVGNCQSWGQCKGGTTRGKSGKPKGNRGFGDWADDDAWSMPDEIADSWDNTGLKDNDKASRGLTDRDSGVPDNLASTKIKGKMQPGGAMPSITLKGLSIKGESKVAYAEAVQAAQTDAQAALSQEQVPKAYRNAVRDYFDDLKK